MIDEKHRCLIITHKWRIHAFCMTIVNTNNKEIFVPLNEKRIDSKESLLKLIKFPAQVSVFRK